MSGKVFIRDALALSPAERLQLIEEIWDSLSVDPDSVPVTDAQRRELDDRLRHHESQSAAGADWNTVKSRISRRP